MAWTFAGKAVVQQHMPANKSKSDVKDYLSKKRKVVMYVVFNFCFGLRVSGEYDACCNSWSYRVGHRIPNVAHSRASRSELVNNNNTVSYSMYYYYF